MRHSARLGSETPEPLHFPLCQTVRQPLKPPLIRSELYHSSGSSQYVMKVRTRRLLANQEVRLVIPTGLSTATPPQRRGTQRTTSAAGALRRGMRYTGIRRPIDQEAVYRIFHKFCVFLRGFLRERRASVERSDTRSAFEVLTSRLQRTQFLLQIPKAQT